MPPQTQDISGENLNKFIALPPDKRRQVFDRMTPDAQQAVIAAIRAKGAARKTPPGSVDPLGLATAVGQFGRAAGGLRESFGIPSKLPRIPSPGEFLTWAQNVLADPLSAAERPTREMAGVAEFIVVHPIEFTAGMLNQPQMQEAWHNKDYARLLGLAMGTAAMFSPNVISGVKGGVRGFQAGLAGQTAREFKAAEELRAAKTVEQGARRGRRDAGGVELKLAKGETPGHPGAAAFQRAVGTTTPIVSKPFAELERKRAAHVRRLPKRFASEFRQEEQAAKTAYGVIDERLGEQQGLLMSLQKQRGDLLKDAVRLHARGMRVEAAGSIENAKAVEEQINKLLDKLDPGARRLFYRANAHYARAESIRAVIQAFTKSFEGLRPEESLPGIATDPGVVRAKQLLQRLHSLEGDRTETLLGKPVRNRLNEALGPERAQYVKNLVARLEELQRRPTTSYWVIRVVGEGMIGVVGAVLGGAAGGFRGGAMGFLAGLGVGALGARGVAEYLVRSGNTVLLDGIMRSAFKGDIAETRRLAERLGQEQGKQLIEQAKQDYLGVEPTATVAPQKMAEAVQAVIEGTDPDVFAGKERAERSMRASVAGREVEEPAREVMTKRTQLGNMLRFLKSDPRKIDPNRFAVQLRTVENMVGFPIREAGDIDRAQKAIAEMLRRVGR